MLYVILTGAFSFLISFFAVPAVIRVAKEKTLYDLPDARKLHTQPIASLGGVGIFLGFGLACLLTISGQSYPELQYFFAAALVTFFLGLKDDILILSAKKKFLGQVAAAAILIHLGHVRIESMHGFLGIGQLNDVASYLLSYITLIVVVNAFNLIDGVDGLAGSLGVLTTLTFGVYFLLANQPMYAMLGFAMAGSLLAFLIYNFAPAKIFMGDSGSLLLGLVNAVLVIKFITISDSASVPLQLDSSVALGFAILIVPLLDTLRVFAIRISKGRSPFAADRNHIHHLLLATNLSHRGVALSCLALNFSFILMAYLGRSLGSTLLISIMVICFFALMAGLKYMKKTKLVFQGQAFQQNAGELSVSASKVVTFKTESAVSEPS